MEKRQFRALHRVFLLRIVSLDLLSSDGDPVRLLGQLAALLAAISMTFCLPLLVMGGYSAQFASIMEHCLPATTMLVTGLIAILSWDSILPDRQDVLILGPLPVEPRTIFLAKLAAIAYLIGLSVIAVNAFSGLLWPLYFGSNGEIAALARSFAAFWITTFLAAAFMLLSVLTLQGVASQLLPRQAFLRVSASIQTAGFCLMLGMYILEPSLESPDALSASENHRLLEWLPSYWFFGAFQILNGSPGRLQPIHAALAHRAWIATGLVLLGAIATLMLSYFRTMRKLIEEPEIAASQNRWTSLLRFGGALPAAISIFSLLTLLRSRQHRVILSFYYGAGLAIAAVYLKTLLLMQIRTPGATVVLFGQPLLAASTVMMCVAVAAVRLVSGLPITLGANWIFQITELRPPRAYLEAVRAALLLVGVAPIWAASGALFFSLWPWRMAAEHMLLLALIGAILVELCLIRFRKIPFTCSYLPGKGNMQFVFWAFGLIVLPLVDLVTKLEMKALDSSLGFAAATGVLGLMLLCVKILASKTQTAPSIRFEENGEPLISALQLDRG